MGDTQFKFRVELLDGSKATISVRVKDGETLTDVVRKIRGFEIRETEMGTYIKGIKFSELLKNENVLVENIQKSGTRNQKDEEQWIQFYVDDGLMAAAGGGEVVFAGIDNVRIEHLTAKGIGEITFREEEKIEKYQRDFSEKDIEAIRNAVYLYQNKNVLEILHAGRPSADVRTIDFNNFVIFSDNGIKVYGENHQSTKPLGWLGWVMPEIKTKEYSQDHGADFNHARTVWQGRYDACILKAIGFANQNKKMRELEICKSEERNRSSYENMEEQKIEHKKIEHEAVDVPAAQLESVRRGEHPVFAQEKNPLPKPKILTTVYTPMLRKYISFDELDEEKKFERVGKRKRTDYTRVVAEEQHKQNILKSYEKMRSKEEVRAPAEFFVKRMKISLQNLVARIENMKKKLESKIATLKERIQKIKTKNLIIKIGTKIKKIKIARDEIKKMKTKLYSKFANGIKKNVAQVKAKLIKTVESLTKHSDHKNKNIRKVEKNKRVIIFLLLEKWFPRIRKVEKCYS